jgi:hypothetical protein
MDLPIWAARGSFPRDFRAVVVGEQPVIFTFFLYFSYVTQEATFEAGQSDIHQAGSEEETAAAGRDEQAAREENAS